MRSFFLTLLGLLLIPFSGVFAQKELTYDFSKGLSSTDSTGPSLLPLGEPGKFVEEVLPELGKKKRIVYQFEENSGLQFDNSSADGFLNGSFTIEIYFRLRDLESWKRVLDFKNRQSDNGCYIYEGRLNFFNFATGEKAPVKPNEYVHYVFSRDVETHEIKMYVDGESKVAFRDPGDEAVLGKDQVLNFFQDDLIARNEASSGAVALIRLYDRVMTPVLVRQQFQQLARTIDASAQVPNPPKETPILPEIRVTAPKRTPTIEITGKVYNNRNLDFLASVDLIVRKVSNDSIVARTKATNGIYRVMVKPFETYKITAVSQGFKERSILVSPTRETTEVQTLLNLSEEDFDEPILHVPFLQSDSALSENGIIGLDSALIFLKSRPDLQIILHGHTDNVGEFDKNLALSEQRVLVVKAFLVQKGISAERISGQGYGPTRPRASNNSEPARQRNRRVEIWVEAIKR
ncbi:OmpA family protein [Arundinibacter roseus]|nr:OmpA family protein [Arundinibacter roseus]